MVNLLITTGLRRGELCGLQWRDIDRKNMLLNLRRNVTLDTTHKHEKNPENKIHVGELKGRRSRKVALPAQVDKDICQNYDNNHQRSIWPGLHRNELSVLSGTEDQLTDKKEDRDARM